MSRSPEQGEVWFGQFDSDIKRRPLVIISATDLISVAEVDYSVLKITSQKSRGIFDVLIDWKVAGLAKESVVRSNKVNVITKAHLMYKTGEIVLFRL